MNNYRIRLGLVVLCASMASLLSFSQSNFNGPIYELKVAGIEEPADIKILVNSVRNSADVDYCRYSQEHDALIVQTKEDLTYGELNTLIDDTGFHLTGDVVTSKGVRMHSNGEISQPEQIE